VVDERGAPKKDGFMTITRIIKQHPIWSFCLLTLLWSFGWWSLILLPDDQPGLAGCAALGQPGVRYHCGGGRPGEWQDDVDA
jgi:hypothetical protein